MCPVSRREAEELFDRIEKNTGFFGDFRRALRALEPKEQPRMWLSPLIGGIPESRVLISNRRILVFRVRLFSSSRLSLISTHDLQTISNVSTETEAGQDAPLTVTFHQSTHPPLALAGLSAETAEKARKLLAPGTSGRPARAPEPAPAEPTRESKPETQGPKGGKGIGGTRRAAQEPNHLWDDYERERKNATGFPDPISRRELVSSAVGVLALLVIPLVGIAAFVSLYVFVGRHASVGFLMLMPVPFLLLVLVLGLLGAGRGLLRALATSFKTVVCPVCQTPTQACTSSTEVFCQHCHTPIHLATGKPSRATRMLACPCCSSSLAVEENAIAFLCDDCGTALHSIGGALRPEDDRKLCPECAFRLPKSARVCPSCLTVMSDVTTEVFHPFTFDDITSGGKPSSLGYPLAARRAGRTNQAHLIHAKACLDLLTQELRPDAICESTSNERVRGYRLFTGLTRLLGSVEVLSNDDEHREASIRLLNECDTIYPKILGLLACHTKLLGAVPLPLYGVFEPKSGWVWAKLRNELAQRAYDLRLSPRPEPWKTGFLAWKDATQSGIADTLSQMVVPVSKTPTYAIADIVGILDEAKRLEPASVGFIEEFADHLAEAFPVGEKRDELGRALEAHARGDFERPDELPSVPAAQELDRLAVEKIEAGDVDAAIDVYKRIVREFPGTREASIAEGTLAVIEAQSSMPCED